MVNAVASPSAAGNEISPSQMEEACFPWTRANRWSTDVTAVVFPILGILFARAAHAPPISCALLGIFLFLFIASFSIANRYYHRLYTRIAAEGVWREGIVTRKRTYPRGPINVMTVEFTADRTPVSRSGWVPTQVFFRYHVGQSVRVLCEPKSPWRWALLEPSDRAA